jgi:hypothetical protein
MIGYVQLKDPSFERDGQLYVSSTDLTDWREVPYILNAKECEHTETMCPECIATWEIDYFVKVSSEGPPTLSG